MAMFDRAASHEANIASPTEHSQDGGADSEWEYEYDDEETEDFYFTLDLTTHVPNAVAIRESSRNGKLKARTETAAERTAREERSAGLPRRLATLGPDGGSDGSPAEAAKLQVLDLHSANPYVKFNDGVYSCNWHTDLGTQFYVARPGVTENVLRPGHVVDVVGISQARLVGRPVTLQPKSGTANKTTPGTSASTSTTAAQRVRMSRPADAPAVAASDFSSLRPGEQLVIGADRIKNEAMGKQASFLERLSAIKLKRGERDIIPVSGVRFYDPPADKDAIRARAAADELRQNGSADQPPEAKRRRTSQQNGGRTDQESRAESSSRQSADDRPSNLPTGADPWAALPADQHRSGTVQYEEPSWTDAQHQRAPSSDRDAEHEIDDEELPQAPTNSNGESLAALLGGADSGQQAAEGDAHMDAPADMGGDG